ncbi:uracil-DNA glycosylase [Henriciella aquimarina]|uniref:uracil-DNA glycosylase n=1 Tax=Henriciella aquimarina TaxID=545261 RepID=UPI0009FF2773|nr:uracil-DNA glycosylase [Henriciella aquimarina]
MTERQDVPAEPPVDCSLCPRLVAYRLENAEKHPDWFNGAVPSFGDPQASILVVGLAPGVSGANKTGRPFTGDWAGDLLYATLDKFGLSSGAYDARPDDGLALHDAMITNAVRCVPPANKPVGAEINTCRPFLQARIDALPRLKVLLCLGKIAHDSTVRGLGLKLKDHPFGHESEYTLPNGLTLLSSYHCSRYNTNTRRLTPEMFESVFARARALSA